LEIQFSDSWMEESATGYGNQNKTEVEEDKVWLGVKLIKTSVRWIFLKRMDSSLLIHTQHRNNRIGERHRWKPSAYKTKTTKEKWKLMKKESREEHKAEFANWNLQNKLKEAQPIFTNRMQDGKGIIWQVRMG